MKFRNGASQLILLIAIEIVWHVLCRKIFSPCRVGQIVSKKISGWEYLRDILLTIVLEGSRKLDGEMGTRKTCPLLFTHFVGHVMIKYGGIQGRI